MGLSVLKWAYDLGVKQERQRIARLLEHTATNSIDYIDTAYNMLADEKSMSKARKDKLAKRVEINSAVRDIIAVIMSPKQDYVVTEPLLFQDEEKK